MELLLLGQIDNASPPASAAGELYALSTGFGAPTGTATDLHITTTTVAPWGPIGSGYWRRAQVLVRYTAACTVTITPYADFDLPQTVTAKTYTSPAQSTIDSIDIFVAKRCTYVSLDIVVSGAQGYVEILGASAGGKALTLVGSSVVGSAS